MLSIIGSVAFLNRNKIFYSFVNCRLNYIDILILSLFACPLSEGIILSNCFSRQISNAPVVLALIRFFNKKTNHCYFLHTFIITSHALANRWFGESKWWEILRIVFSFSFIGSIFYKSFMVIEFLCFLSIGMSNIKF